MKLDIRTSAAEPRRQAYAYLTRRFGEDRAATRYEEAIYDLQSTTNFHYRPIWQPEFELFDVKKTAIVLADWYALLDPRQFYYATYNISRAGLEAANTKAFEFAEKQELLAELSADARARALDTILPMRHYEWGANRILWSICDRGYGTAVADAAAFAAMDRLGMAQVITRLGLALDGQTGGSVGTAKKAWMDAPEWQGVRRLVEDSFVIDDWFEAFVAQNLAMDGIVHRLVWDEVRKALRHAGGTGLVMVTDIVGDVYADQAKWIDAVVKTAAAASPENKAKLGEWLTAWTARAVEAATPLAKHALGAKADEAIERLARELSARAAKLGIAEVAS
jgi:phenol hydroxylase P1 protein